MPVITKLKPSQIDYFANNLRHKELLREVADAVRCSTCKGSGKYYGLQVVESCQSCAGKGWSFAECRDNRK